MSTARKSTGLDKKPAKKLPDAEFIKCVDILRSSAQQMKFIELAEMLDQVACDAAMKPKAKKSGKTA